MTVLNLQKIRAHFPALNQQVDGVTPIFLDGPGGTQVPKAVPEAMVNYLQYSNSNLLNSQFFAVKRTHELVAQARSKAAAFVNAPRADDIIFGQSMSAITAHLSRSISREWNAGDEIIITALEHYSNASFWQRAAVDRGITCHIVKMKPDDCTLDYQHLESLISPKTKFIAFTLASNVTGSRTDAARIIAAAKTVGALTYVDSVHAAPHYLPDVQALGCDFLACSAYKFYGPHLGFVFGKQEHFERLVPYKVEPAPSTSPECWEMGTKSFEALAGLSATIDYMASYHEAPNLRQSLQKFYDELFIYEQSLSQHFLQKAQTVTGMKIYGITDISKLDARTPTFGFTLEGHTPQTISDYLAAANIITGAGNFYAKGVMDSLGLSETGGIVRAGCVHYNTIDEINRLFTVLEEI